MADRVEAGLDRDVELMLRVKEADEEVFDELVRRYREPLTNFFYSLCWNIHTAQDCAQEVLVRLWLARERYEPSAKLSTYIFRVARNHWLTALRRRKCRPEPMYLEEMWQPVVDDGSLEKLLMRRYMDRRIKLAIAGLPERYRLVFVLSHFQGMKYAQIAEVLEIPVGTVKSRMSAAVRVLREKIAEEMGDER
ncbi:MAG TPA: RNA polymerase sigma factor [Armatimonadota bacterium]|nr:RNA polymerase sigma factor [Armatimonadota bacterium]